MSTDSDYVSLDTSEPAQKFSRSLSTNVLMTSDEDPQLNKPKDLLTIRTRSHFTSMDNPFSRENSNCLTVTPTPELSKLNISPSLSFTSIKTENISPAPDNEPEIIELDYRPSSACSTSVDKNLNRNRSSAEEENSSSPNNTINPQCQQCNAEFKTLNDFIDHMRTTHLNNNNTDFHCRICDRSFPSQQEKLAHSIEHYLSTKANYSCRTCERNFLSATEFRTHFTSAHTEILFRCNVCLQIFTDKGIYQEHIISHAIEETKIECIMCGIEFDGPESFSSHIQVIHERADSNLPTNKSTFQSMTSKFRKNSSVEETAKVSKNLKCFVCDEKYTNEQDLDTHRLLTHCKVPKSDRCAVCHQNLANLEQFFAHTKDHCTDPNNEVNCVICRQTVRNETLLKMHGEFHLGAEKAQQTICQICSKSISLDNLAQHILQHTFENSLTDSDISFVCQCGQRFDDASELQIHSLVHLKEVTSMDGESNQDAFACSRCSRKFSTISALQGHSHIHINRKFACKKCRQSFSTPNRLMSHQKRHVGEKNVKCQICDTRFRSQELLDTHMQIHELKLHANDNSTPISPIET